MLYCPTTATKTRPATPSSSGGPASLIHIAATIRSPQVADSATARLRVDNFTAVVHAVWRERADISVSCFDGFAVAVRLSHAVVVFVGHLGCALCSATASIAVYATALLRDLSLSRGLRHLVRPQHVHSSLLITDLKW
ncbi:hypothetical protein CCR75_001663 [Bremia lactucae]|uniref:Uncharacterized protein n=1 Tax=Bremia lactucae TaxID=4779 RepID=A0A976FPF3_BRELC|nr:hypothetical protein CCR75_001663 [Bremia lactucae]